MVQCLFSNTVGQRGETYSISQSKQTQERHTHNRWSDTHFNTQLIPWNEIRTRQLWRKQYPCVSLCVCVCWVSWSLVSCLSRFLSPPRRSLALPPSSPSSSSCHPPSSSCLCLAGCRPARPSRVVRRSDPATSARPADPESTRREKTQNHFIIRASEPACTGSIIKHPWLSC